MNNDISSNSNSLKLSRILVEQSFLQAHITGAARRLLASTSDALPALQERIASYH